MSDEKILVVPRNLIPNLWQGFQPAAFAGEGESLTPDAIYQCFIRDSSFTERGPAEMDATLKQIIPQIVLVSGSKVFMLKRLPKSGEVRLHHKYTLTVGGHINPEDSTNSTVSFTEDADPILEGAMREADEEIVLPEGVDVGLQLVGYINDDSGEPDMHGIPPVGQVHIGVLFIAQVDPEAIDLISVKETDKLEGRWVELADVVLHFDKLEPWSQIIFAVLDSNKDNQSN